MARRTQWVVFALIVILVAAGYVGYYESTVGTNNTYANCVISGVGGFEFRVISASTGAPISGATIKAVDTFGCSGESQVIYVGNFSESLGGGGWLVPDFPSLAVPAGQLSFTVAYQGATYSFSGSFPPIGTSCVTLSIPSGNVTTTSVMNGSGSYCSQA